MMAHARAGFAGGMIGFVIVGLLEAAVVLWQAQSLGDLGVLPFAVVAYGIAGAFGGFGLGLALGLIVRPRPGAFRFYAATFFFVGAAVIGRFRIVRDVFDERMPQGPMALLGQLAGFALLAVVAIVVGRLVGGRVSLSRPFGAFLKVSGLALVFGLLSLAVRFAMAPSAIPSRAAPTGAPPIILIMVDTLRADHLSAYGAERVKTPNIDRLAADGVRFENAHSQASWTRPSVATIMTSLYPSSHGAVHKGDLLGDSVDTVAEALQAHGYRTFGFPNNANVTETFNFQQGFDRYTYLAPALYFHASESAAELIIYKQLRVVRERFLSQRRWVENYYQPATVVTDRALEVVRREEANPFFLFLHYMDPHDPYFEHPFNGRGVARVATPNPPADRAAELQGLYEAEVEYLDEHLGRLFDGLREAGVYDKAMIVLTADHGEEFFEHGGWWHGTTLYEEQTEVPLIMKPPGRTARQLVADGLVRSLDVAPTILSVAGVKVPAEMQGRSLSLANPGADAELDAVFSEEELEGNVLRAVRGPDWKLILANEGNPRGLSPNELYDLREDPGESRNRFGEGLEAEGQLAAALSRLSAEARKYARAAEQGSVDRATEERLKALGYVD